MSGDVDIFYTIPRPNKVEKHFGGWSEGQWIHMILAEDSETVFVAIPSNLYSFKN